MEKEQNFQIKDDNLSQIQHTNLNDQMNPAQFNEIQLDIINHHKLSKMTYSSSNKRVTKKIQHQLYSNNKIDNPSHNQIPINQIQFKSAQPKLNHFCPKVMKGNITSKTHLDFHQKVQLSHKISSQTQLKEAQRFLQKINEESKKKNSQKILKNKHQERIHSKTSNRVLKQINTFLSTEKNKNHLKTQSHENLFNKTKKQQHFNKQKNKEICDKHKNINIKKKIPALLNLGGSKTMLRTQNLLNQVKKHMENLIIQRLNLGTTQFQEEIAKILATIEF